MMQWLIGNPVVSLIFMVIGVGAIYFWVTGQLVGWVALIAVFIAAAAAQASDKVNAYAAWKREWDGAAGGGVRSGIGKMLRVVFAIGTWASMAWWASEGAQGDPILQAGVTLFWITTAVMVLVWLLPLRRRRPPKRPVNMVVEVCLSAPLQTNSVKAATIAVPSFCQQLLRNDS